MGKEKKRKAVNSERRSKELKKKAKHRNERKLKALERASKLEEKGKKKERKAKELNKKMTLEKAAKAKTKAKKDAIKRRAKEVKAKEKSAKGKVKEKRAKEQKGKALKKVEKRKKAAEKAKKSEERRKKSEQKAKKALEKRQKKEKSAKKKAERKAKSLAKAKKEKDKKEKKRKEAKAKARVAETRMKEKKAKAKAAERKKKQEISKKKEKKYKHKVERAKKAEKLAKAKARERKTKEKRKKVVARERAKKRVAAIAREKKKKKAKQTEKKQKRIKAEKKDKARKKAELKAKTSAKEKRGKARKAKEKAKKAVCLARQKRQKRTRSFTVAVDQAITIAKGWKNWAHGYRGLRLQKQGNVCTISGLIRVNTNTITSGQDAKKKFWHAEELIEEGEARTQLSEVKSTNALLDQKEGASSLLEEGEGAGAGGWGVLASVPRSCRPGQSLYFTVNNHIQPAKVRVSSSGKVSFVSGGTKHGWISLSGIMYKAGKTMAANKSTKKVRIDSTRQMKLSARNGWKGGVTAYKQGHLCFLTGDLKGGKAWKGRILNLPAWCRPSGKLSFAMNAGKAAFRVDVSASGHVYGVGVSNKIARKMSLDSIVFATARGANLPRKKGWTKAKTGQSPQARRVGTLCVVSGSVYNRKVRSGTHCMLKHSGAVATLPSWCRPAKRLIFSTVAPDGKIQRIDVLPQGSVRWTAGKRDKTVNLTGIKFTVPVSVVKKYSRALTRVSKCSRL